jgi:hypothetical protein
MTGKITFGRHLKMRFGVFAFLSIFFVSGLAHSQHQGKIKAGSKVSTVVPGGGKLDITANKKALKANRQSQIVQYSDSLLSKKSVLSTIETDKNGRQEDISKRDLYAKHFVNDNGSFTAIVSASPLHYEENGQYHNIDGSITPNTTGAFQSYAYANTTNLMKTYFSEIASNGLLSISKEGAVKEFTNTRIFWEQNGMELNSIHSNSVLATVNNEKITYPNIYPFVDAQYTLTAGRRELNYIISDPSIFDSAPNNAEYLVFAEDIVLDQNWDYEMNEDGVYLIDAHKNVRYLYENPVVGEGFGNAGYKPYLFDNSISNMRAVRNGDIITILTKVKVAWLTNPSRIFPLAIDPTGSYYPNTALTLSTGYTRKVGTNNATKINGSINFGRAAASNDLLRGFCQFNLASLYSILGTAVTANVSGMRMKVAASFLGSAGVFAGRLTSQNPISATGNNLHAAIAYTTTASTAYYGVFNNTGLPTTNTMYGGSLVGNASANPITDLNANFGAGSQFFNVGFRANGDGTTFANNTYWTLYGASGGTLAPVLEIDYTVPSSPPSCGTYISPANGITNAATGNQLTWSAISGVTSYDVSFGTSSNPAVVANVTTTSYNPGCLQPNTTYYWKVSAINEFGTASGCSVWSFTTTGQAAIYSQNFDGFTEGMFSNTVAQDGWLASTIGSGSRNVWAAHNETGYSIAGNSIGVSAYSGTAPVAGGKLVYFDDVTTDRWLYRNISTANYKDITVTFRYKVGGEIDGTTLYDYGSVIYNPTGVSPQTLTNWLEDTSQGGTNNDNRFHSQTNATYDSILLPTDADNNANLRLGFRWISDTAFSTYPSFVVDDIVVTGCPTGGNITPLSTTLPSAGSAVLTANNTAGCSLYQWEESASSTGPWTNATTGTGATTSIYNTGTISTTTYYRCKVYFGSCEPSYQSVAVVNIEIPCDAQITSISNAAAICSGGTTSLTATANDSGHTIRWYSSSTGQTVLGTGTSYTTSALSATTTFFAAAFNGTCESVRQSVVITVSPYVAILNKVIGTPANGTSHNIALSWSAVSGITNYVVEYSENNAAWTLATTTTGTSYTFNAGDNPDKQYFFRIKAQGTNCYTESGPVYTAADNPIALVLSNPSGTTMQITIAAETPVTNPAHTTYAIMSEGSGLYVQADGSLGSTAVYRTKAVWGTITVTGLTPVTQYCFIAMAKNQDGDVRFAVPAALMGIQEFNSNVLTTNTSTAGWYAPNSNTQFAWTPTGGCPAGKIGFGPSTFNNFWGNFVRLPDLNATGKNEIKLTLDLSNSFTAARINSYVRFYIWADGAYKNVVTATKVNGAAITTDNYGKILFNALRTCEPVEITFNLATIINKASILVYLEASSGYNNSDPFSFSFDNVAISENTGASTTACLNTTVACSAAITGVTNGSGCGQILLQATGSPSTTSYNWYDAAATGNLLATTPTGQWNSPIIAQTTVYYVAAFNGTCESGRTAVTANKTGTSAGILSASGASLCGETSVILYAETIDDAIYTVNWYDSPSGGAILHTGFDYSVSPTEDTTYYVAAAEGVCESARQPVDVVIASKRWNGSLGTDWNQAGNWTPAGLPDLSNCVVIPATANQPIVEGGNAFSKTLTVEAGATLIGKNKQYNYCFCRSECTKQCKFHPRKRCISCAETKYSGQCQYGNHHCQAK